MLDRNLGTWDIPVTDEFLDGVRHGVRRRRSLRRAAAAGALLATTAITTLAVALAGSSGSSPTAPPPTAPLSAAGPVVDGFRITRLPDGVVTPGAESRYTAAVAEEGLRNDGRDAAAGEPKALVTMRRFDRGVGVGLFVTVLRPQPGARPTLGAAEIGGRLARWASDGASPVRTFDVPAGTARLLAHVGSETTTHEVVITTPHHVVITIEGNAAFTAAELAAVAHGISG